MDWLEAALGAKMLCSLDGSDTLSRVSWPFAETARSVATDTARAIVQIVGLDCWDMVLSSVDSGLLLE